MAALWLSAASIPSADSVPAIQETHVSFFSFPPFLKKSTNILQVTNDLGGAAKEKDGEDDYPYYDFHDDDEDLMPVGSDEAEEEEEDEEVDLDEIRNIVPEGYEILEVVVIKEEEEDENDEEGEKNGVESGAVKPIEVNAEADDL